MMRVPSARESKNSRLTLLNPRFEISSLALGSYIDAYVLMYPYVQAARNQKEKNFLIIRVIPASHFFIFLIFSNF